MRSEFSRLKVVPTWLCCVLAAVLILNGAFAPLGMPQPASNLHTLSMGSHCQHHVTTQFDATQPSHGTCPCFGGVCHCGCVTVFAASVALPDLRPITPQRFIANFSVPQSAAVLPSRLLRPPIV